MTVTVGLAWELRLTASRSRCHRCRCCKSIVPGLANSDDRCESCLDGRGNYQETRRQQWLAFTTFYITYFLAATALPQNIVSCNIKIKIDYRFIYRYLVMFMVQYILECIPLSNVYDSQLYHIRDTVYNYL